MCYYINVAQLRFDFLISYIHLLSGIVFLYFGWSFSLLDTTTRITTAAVLSGLTCQKLAYEITYFLAFVTTI